MFDLMGYGFGFHGFGMFLFWGVVLVLIFWLFKEDSKGNVQNQSAIEILNSRYAKGEISETEYLNKKKDIVSTNN